MFLIFSPNGFNLRVLIIKINENQKDFWYCEFYVFLGVEKNGFFLGIKIETQSLRGTVFSELVLASFSPVPHGKLPITPYSRLYNF